VRGLLAGLGLLLGAGTLAAQNVDSALVRRVDSVFATWSGSATPGCAVGVDRGGAPLIRRAYGLMNLETGTPWTVGTLSESGSVAKQFTAAGIVLLARDGMFSLDDDISRWIPEVKGLGRKITIRHLLTHTSGLPDRYTLHDVQGRPAGEVDHANPEVLAIVARLRELNFDPGEDYLYSNTGFIVAATLLERASGQTLQAFTSARIFGPLGMTSTRWREDHRVVVPGRASAYSGTITRGFRNDHPFTRVIGSGGLLTTVNDFLKWEAALQEGTGPWGAVRDSLERVGRLNDGTVLTYALGVGVDRWRGVRRVSHTGSTGGYRAALSRFPEQQVAIALLCNLGSIDPGEVAQRVATLVLGPALAAPDTEPTAVAVDSATLRSLTGAFYSARTEEPMVLMIRNGQLGDSTAGTPFVSLAPDRFKFRGGRRILVVLATPPGAPRRVRVEAPNARSVEYVAVARPRLDSASLAEYAGDYRSPELGAGYHLAIRGDTLRILRGWETPIPLAPFYQDGFRAGNAGVIRFVRDSRGKVTGFVLWTGRVRHLRFERNTESSRSP
jgi:CubicO group peptidase (beta-lactamase class C family)